MAPITSEEGENSTEPIVIERAAGKHFKNCHTHELNNIKDMEQFFKSHKGAAN